MTYHGCTCEILEGSVKEEPDTSNGCITETYWASVVDLR